MLSNANDDIQSAVDKKQAVVLDLWGFEKNRRLIITFIIIFQPEEKTIR